MIEIQERVQGDRGSSKVLRTQEHFIPNIWEKMKNSF
jgi:hypothetical protein